MWMVVENRFAPCISRFFFVPLRAEMDFAGSLEYIRAKNIGMLLKKILVSV